MLRLESRTEDGPRHLIHPGDVVTITRPAVAWQDVCHWPVARRAGLHLQAAAWVCREGER